VAWAGVAYSGLAAPSVDDALTVCRRLGYRRIIVQPYFLFDGVLVKRIEEATRRHDEADPATQFVSVSHLRNHPLLIKAFEDRAHEAVHGSPNMNCDLCKFRVRLIGREADLGAPQEANHHHARAGFDDDHGHRRHVRKARSAQEPLDPESHPWDERLLQRLLLNA
jgi:sirohydrochlorin cobaltochelatase